MPQITGIFKLDPYAEDNDCQERSEVQAFLNFLDDGQDARLWEDPTTCANNDPPRSFLDEQKEKRHYHYIVTFDTENDLEKAFKTACDEIDCDPGQDNSLSWEDVRNIDDLLYWIENIRGLQEIEIPEDYCGNDEDFEEDYETPEYY